MKFCQPHWDMCREAIKDRGMDGLVMKSGEAMIEKALEGEEPDFDPLMQMHWFLSNEALRCGGLYLMCETPDGSNEGHYCPVCEFEKHAEGFVAKTSIDVIADDIMPIRLTPTDTHASILSLKRGERGWNTL